MAIVNFSIPDEVKKAFDRAFKGRNKSAIVADLMRQAIESVEGRARAARAIRELRKLRDEGPAVTDEAIRTAREAGRR